MDRPQVIKDLELAYGKTFVQGKYEENAFSVNADGEVIELNISKVETLDFVGNILSLEGLTIELSGAVDLSPIQNLTNLKFLTLEVEPTNLCCLKSLVNLESLHLRYTRVKTKVSLEPLAHLSKLRVLSINSWNVSGFEYLNDLQNLENISLQNVDFNHIHCLKSSMNLKVLNLENTQLCDSNSHYGYSSLI